MSDHLTTSNLLSLEEMIFLRISGPIIMQPDEAKPETAGGFSHREYEEVGGRNLPLKSESESESE